MQKQPLITQVKDKLTEKGIRFLPGRETDLYLRGEYYDAGSSAAMKKICYEASVYFDESSCKVYMWDIAAFVESEPAFPEGTGADIKSGMTLYRNVKYTKTGPEGKTSDIVFNLYEIPMAVKDTARQYGWKFKIVLDRERSLLPAAVLPMNHARAIEYRNPQNCHRSFRLSPYSAEEFINKSGKLYWILNVPLIWLTVFTYLTLGIYPVGWFMAASAFMIAYLLNRRAAKSGNLATVILFMCTVLGLFIILIHTMVFDLTGFSVFTL